MLVNDPTRTSKHVLSRGGLFGTETRTKFNLNLNLLSIVQIHQCQYQLIKSIKYAETLEALTYVPYKKQ